MRCTSPRTVGFKSDGKTIAWSRKDYSKEFSTFQLPCGKCLNCRLDYARQWAVRCVHEAKMNGSNNCFITLTYSDENLSSDKLYYVDFQNFMKRLRKKFPNTEIGVFVTGEYGDKKKRPHWHALLFNWRPSDEKYFYSTDRGDKVFSSRILGPKNEQELNDWKNWDQKPLWTFGKCEFGEVTFESAGYCARYAAKKLVHGNDGHGYEPISKKSNKHAIGKKFLEKYHDDIFNYGELVLKDSQGIVRPVGAIPRYYEKWLQKHHPEKWVRYVTEVKVKKEKEAVEKAARDQATRPYTNSKAMAVALITLENVKNRLFKFTKL